MYCETEPTFERADVVLEEVRVFVEVNGFKGQFAETLSSVSISGGLRCYSSTAEFGAGSVLKCFSFRSVNEDWAYDRIRTW